MKPAAAPTPSRAGSSGRGVRDAWREVLADCRTVVLKVGTNVLARADGRIDAARVRTIADGLRRIRATGRRAVLVSSGAVGAGLEPLGLTERPTDLSHLQAVAAIGQARLIGLYDDALRAGEKGAGGTANGEHLRAAQLLLTADDFRDRRRYLNARNTLATLFEYPAVPILNENDTVRTQEIALGDNDQLAGMIVGLVPDPLLVVLTSAAGLIEGDPHAADARPVPLVPRWSERLLDLAGASATKLGTGGMRSKLLAVRDATAAGVDVVLADGRDPGTIPRVLAGDPVGTLFRGAVTQVPAWKRWIGYTVRPAGSVRVDAGARRAVEDRGRSLLPIGVTDVVGPFAAGEAVSLLGPAGDEFARGLSNYADHELRRLAGHTTDEAAALLGGVPYIEAVHRDNLALLPR